VADVIDIRPTALDGVLDLRPETFTDDRGFFVATYEADQLGSAGIDVPFVLEAQSRSRRGTIRGLHYRDPPQSRLVRVARGAILDVVVDIRQGSPTFARHLATQLDDVDHHGLFIPPGFAHGFCVLSPLADVVYGMSEPYDRKAERGIAWDDPDLGIPWPVSTPILSDRDRRNPRLSEIFETLS
jgi:dTDP-4-dehydrorhamnose 3,5-epimerase